MVFLSLMDIDYFSGDITSLIPFSPLRYFWRTLNFVRGNGLRPADRGSGEVASTIMTLHNF